MTSLITWARLNGVASLDIPGRLSFALVPQLVTVPGEHGEDKPATSDNFDEAYDYFRTY